MKPKKRATATKRKKPSTPKKPKKKVWSPEDDEIVLLHCTYWIDVWNLNNFHLYDLYWQHMPIRRKGEVRDLYDAIGMGEHRLARDRIRNILARIWKKEDWDKVIRDPKLLEHDILSLPEMRKWLAIIKKRNAKVPLKNEATAKAPGTAPGLKRATGMRRKKT